MEHLLELARQLGKKVAEHQRTVLLKQAQKAVDDDPKAVEIVQQYQQQVGKIHRLEQERKPIEVADKRKLADLETSVITNPILTTLTKRQVDFVELMQKIKTTIDKQLEI